MRVTETILYINLLLKSLKYTKVNTNCVKVELGRTVIVKCNVQDIILRLSERVQILYRHLFYKKDSDSTSPY